MVGCYLYVEACNTTDETTGSMGTNMKLPVLCSVGMGTNMKLPELCSLDGRQYSVIVYTSILILHLLNYFFELQLVHIDFRTNTCLPHSGRCWLENHCCDREKANEASDPTTLPWAMLMNFYAPLSLRTIRLFCTSWGAPSSWGSIPKGEKGK
jgi:hypothetical protein